MISRISIALVLLLIGLGGPLSAAEKEAQQPILRLEPGGPTSFLSSLAFSPDGQRLYAAGSDKVVYVWTREAASGEFLLDAPATYRLPIGPGMHGVLNALAVSPDGSLLAVAGQGVVHVASDMRSPGIEVPEIGSLDDDGYRQQGTIYVFDTRQRTAKPLVGHLGPVLALAFAPAMAGKPPLLVSAAKEWDSAAGKYTGAVRLWDAASGKYLGGAQLAFALRRPALVAWHTGAEIRQLRVAVAWGDAQNRLRTWDVAKNTLVDAPDGDLNNVAVAGPAPGELLTGCIGRLKQWRLPVDGAPAVQRELTLPPQAAPRAITLFASRADGRLDRAAVVVRFADRNGEDRLRVVDLDAFRLLDVDVPLWTGRGAMPAIHAVARGRSIAVTGGTGHELLVFAIDDLLAGRARSQSLRAPGITPRFAEFVRQKNRLGLLVSQQPPPQPEGVARAAVAGDLLFDPRAGVTGPNAHWTTSTPQTQGWKLTHRRLGEESARPAEVRYEVRLQSPDGATVPIRLQAGYEPTAYAVLPPNPRFAMPLVAVAAHNLGQPSLHLYNGRTGEPLRMCQEHVEQIRSLGFSADGRFLLSVGDDRMICVWSLLDLDDIIGKRGALGGVALKQEQGKIVVAAVSEGSPPQLAKGDVLSGIVEQGRLRAIASPLEFYLALSRIKPGQTVTLARSRADGQQDRLPVRVGQGVDERKPLFVLFITREPRDGRWQWFGWSPLGWYDASQNAAARLLGWHFNTPDAPEPARFAQAQEYPNLFHPGLLPELLDGKTPVDRPPPLPRPAVKLSVKEPDQPCQLVDNAEVAIYRHRGAELRLQLMGPASDHLGLIAWQLGAGPATPCQEVGSHEWSIPLASFPRSRDEQKLRITIRTNETEPQVFSEEAAVRYRALPPAITAIAPEKPRTVVHEAAFRFRARLASLDPQLASRLQVTLIHSAGPDEILRESWTSPATADLEKPLKLKEGDNVIQLSAVNVADGTPVAHESSAVTRTVTYSPLHVPPPQIALSLSAAGEGQTPLAEGSNETIVVDRPAVRLHGVVSAGEPLAELSWRRDKTSPPEPLTGFQPLKDATVKVSQEIRLEPGPQTVSCAAKTPHSVRTAASWKVFYRPPLPQLVWTSPAEEMDLVDGRDGRSMVVRGRYLAIPEDRGKQPFELSILRNGKPLPLTPDVDARQRTFAVKVELEPGMNRLQWRATHRWEGQALSDVRIVRCLRLPAIDKVDAPGNVKDPFVNCSVYVRSPAALPLRAVTLNDRPVPLDGAVMEKRGADADLWKIAVPRFPLEEGPNTIAVSARNDDGWALEPRKLAVKVTMPPPPKAEVAFLSPLEDSRTDSDQLKVRMSVKSASRIEGLSLRRGGRQLWQANPAGQVEHGPDGFELAAETDVPLLDGVNVLEAVAINRGGESPASVRVTYVPRPVRLFIDRVEAVSSGQETAATLEEGGRPVFAKPAADGIAWVHGRIRWASENARSLWPKAHLYVSVNGFLQPSVILGSQPELEQTWKAKIRLNQPKDNKVTVLLPGLSQDASNRSEFHIDCRNPDTRQRLLLLVVSIPHENEEALTRQALEAVQGKLVGTQKDLATPALPRGKIFATLTGERASRHALINQLFNIRFAINQTIRPDDLGNDVVLIYYRGPEAVEESGQFHLLTSENEVSAALSGTDLALAFDKAPGAQVFLLDVKRSILNAKSPAEARSLVPQWPAASRIAALRCAWLNREQLPPDAGLLLATLKRVVPSASNLYEINADVSRKLQDKREYGETLIYDQYIPADLNNLVLRTP